MTARLLLVAGVACLLLPGRLLPASAAGGGPISSSPATPPAATAGPTAPARPATTGSLQSAGSQTPPWRAVLDRAVEASRSSAYEGRLAIVSFGDTGPNLAEIEVAQGTGGGLQVGRAETWLLGRDADHTSFWQPQAGTLLRLGNVEQPSFSIADLLHKYTVSERRTAELRTGPAIELAIRARDADRDCERLYVDRQTGLVVRRETYADDGSATRLVAFTDLHVSQLSITAPTGLEETTRGPAEPLTLSALGDLDDVGWAVPSSLAGGYTLRTGYAMPEANGTSLHLVYSDGLYTLSVYEQVGRVDRTALRGATAVSASGMYAYRWPGSEPERLVWTGDERTFTAISDAPYGQVLAAVSSLPSDPPPSFAGRLWRGTVRMADWLWPFNGHGQGA